MALRVLVVSEHGQERAVLKRLLREQRYAVRGVRSVEHAIEALGEAPFELVYLSQSLEGGAHLVQRSRELSRGRSLCFVAIAEPELDHHEWARLVARGFQSVIRRPLCPVDILASASAPARWMAWVHQLKNPAAFRSLDALTITQLPPWAKLGSLICQDLAAVAGADLMLQPGWPFDGAEAPWGASLALSLTQDELEVRVSVAASPAGKQWLSQQLFGEKGSEADLEDAVRELANTAGGVVKRALLDQEVVLTASLPELGSLPGEQCCSTWTLTPPGAEASGARLAVGLAAVTCRNRHVTVAELEEGMVLAADLRNPGGALLAPAGLRLTETAVAKLKNMLDPTLALEVAS